MSLNLVKAAELSLNIHQSVHDDDDFRMEA